MDGFYKPYEEKHDHMYENKQHSPLWLLLNLRNNADIWHMMNFCFEWKDEISIEQLKDVIKWKGCMLFIQI